MKVMRKTALPVPLAPVVEVEAGAQLLNVLDNRALIVVERKVHVCFRRCRSGPDVGGLDCGVELGCIAALFAWPVARCLAPTEWHMVVDARGRQIHGHQSR